MRFNAQNCWLCCQAAVGHVTVWRQNGQRRPAGGVGGGGVAGIYAAAATAAPHSSAGRAQKWARSAGAIGTAGRTPAQQECQKTGTSGKQSAPKSRLRGGEWLARGHHNPRVLLSGPQLSREEPEDLQLDSQRHHLREAPARNKSGPLNNSLWGSALNAATRGRRKRLWKTQNARLPRVGCLHREQLPRRGLGAAAGGRRSARGALTATNPSSHCREGHLVSGPQQDSKKYSPLRYKLFRNPP